VIGHPLSKVDGVHPEIGGKQDSTGEQGLPTLERRGSDGEEPLIGHVVVYVIGGLPTIGVVVRVNGPVDGWAYTHVPSTIKKSVIKIS